MAIIKTRAITLRKTDFSDTSQVLLFLTADQGVISALARGSKRPGNPFQGAIDLIGLNEIVYYEKRSGLHSLTEVDQITHYPRLRQQIARTYCAGYACELILQLAQQAQHPKELFDLLAATLYNVEVSENLVQTLFMFEISALALGGFLPLLDGCVACGGEMDRSSVRAFFSPRLGGLVCADCRPEVTGLVPLAAGGVSVVRALAGGVARPDRLRITPGQAADVRRLLDRFVETVLGTRLKSRKFLHRIGPS